MQRTDDNETFAKLAEVALVLADSSVVDSVCHALSSDRLQPGSTAPTRAAISDGLPSIEHALEQLQRIWNDNLAGMSGDSLALVLRTPAIAAQKRSSQLPFAQVVWTGPKSDNSFLRSTREVIRELIRNAKKAILVIGYWIVAQDDGDGIVQEIVTSLAQAAARGVTVAFILDERARAVAGDNRQVLLRAWPSNVAFPEILTWKLPLTDQHLKLHAKVLVADGWDALVTSANLTYHALDKNMEMGVRVVGPPAKSIADHFIRLIDDGILTPFEANEAS